MDVKLEKAAMKGYELPKGLTLAEQGYYLALRTLYAAYQIGRASCRERVSAIV